MNYAVNAQEMKQYDNNTIEYYGIPSTVLMERAALAVFYEITGRFYPDCGKILVLCGAGNNGGDGFALARLLYLKGYQTQIFFAMDEGSMTPETKAQCLSAQKYNVPQTKELLEYPYTVIVDALFGIGLARPIEGRLASLINKINHINAYKIALDISSGISADTGSVLGTAFCADLTVTFAFAKIGHLLYPGAEYTGELIIKDIGIDKHSFLGKAPQARYLTTQNAKQMLPIRSPYSNKGTFGKALVIAGSPEMAGAAYFAAKAAYYSGCGLVRILTPNENRDILLTKLPEAVLSVYDAKADDLGSLMDLLEVCMDWADAVLIGPGLGQSPASQMLVTKALQYTDKKIVFDADALNILSKNMVLLKESKAQRIVTPHLGEMGRMAGKSIKEIQAGLLKIAQDFAKEYQAVCILKDAGTVIGLPEGEYYINTTGNCGMATGGSGDVLAGIVTGFLAQGLELGNAAAAAVCLHGEAGDKAAEKRGSYGMVASDLLEEIPGVVRRVSQLANINGTTSTTTKRRKK